MNSKKKLMAVLLVVLLVSACFGVDHGASTTKPGDESPTADQQTAASIITLIISVEDRRPPVPVSRAAWSVALVFARGTHDADAKSWIMREWKSAWKDPANAPILTGAMAIAGDDREFLIPDVLKAWKSSTDEGTLTSMAYWVAHFGDADDVKFLEEKENSLKAGVPAVGIIQNALNWRQFWDSGEGGPGPAHGAPLPY